MAVRQVYEQTPDVALEFFKLSYPKRAVKSTLKPEMPDLRRNEEGLTAPTANPPVVHADAAGAVAAAPQPDTAVQIAARLREIGDEIEESIARDFQDKFKTELSRHSVFTLSYDAFKVLFTTSLASVQGRVRSGWQQVFLLYTGYAQVANEAVTQAGPAAAQPRLRSLANDLREFMRDTRLEDWMEEHGGWVEFGSEVNGEEQVVQIDVPHEGTSVD